MHKIVQILVVLILCLRSDMCRQRPKQIQFGCVCGGSDSFQGRQLSESLHLGMFCKNSEPLSSFPRLQTSLGSVLLFKCNYCQREYPDCPPA